MATLRSIHCRPPRANGFSVMELVMVAGIVLILAAFAAPAVFSAYQAYQLSDVTSQVAGVVKFTRYDAIHRNTRVPCIIAQTAASPPLTRIWSDSNGNQAMDPNEKQLVLGGNVNLVDGGGVPGAGNLPGLVGVPTFSPVPLSLAILGFDSRGALTTKGAYAVYITNLSAPSSGSRAIILLPSGSIQIWSGDAQGNWHFVN